ncbi:unnamed protein product [Phytomonas sp. Hart1]|nr:unnamed protein product [Phytomonas sp. Hart1]|eukprot:CCW66266.1 unnamed protein product [Phytomonas sp. isolate Hart1]
MPPKKRTVAKSGAGTDASLEHEETSDIVTDLPASGETLLANGDNPAAIFAQLQQTVEGDATKINNHLGSLMSLVQAAENSQTSIFLRVRFLELIARYVVHIRDNNALKKIVTSLIKIIGGDDNTPQLLVAALQCFSGLGSVSMLEKQWEYLSREGADILMQVIIDKEAFPEPVRQAARKSLDDLTESAFQPVVTKLLHWLSDDREDDEEEQLLKERHMALTVLNRLSRMVSLKSQWTEEVQELVYNLILRILDVVNVREFSQLARIAAHLPIIVAKGGGNFLLKSYLSNHKLDSNRQLEAVVILGRFVQVKDQSDELDLTPALEAAGLLAHEIDAQSEHGYLSARIVLLTARLAGSDTAEKLLSFIFHNLMHLLGADGTSLPENISTLEALLFAMVAIARKKPIEVLQKIHEENFNASMINLMKAMTSLENHTLFSVKKLVMKKEAKDTDAEMLTCLHNICVIAGSASSKHLPLIELKESWAERPSLSVLKHTGSTGGRTTALSLPPGTAASTSVLRNSRGGPQKRQRSQMGRSTSNGGMIRSRR